MWTMYFGGSRVVKDQDDNLYHFESYKSVRFFLESSIVWLLVIIG